MPEPARLEPSALETIFETLLADHPDAYVTAIDPGANGFFVPMPDSIKVDGRFVLQGRTALDLVVPSDRAVVIAAWEQARAMGAARVVVHLAAEPDASAVISIIDLRARHGVYVGVIVSEAAGRDDIFRPLDRPLMAPRIGRVTKNELATIVDVDAAMTRILGWSAEEMIGHRSLEFLHPDDQERAIRNWMRTVETHEHPTPIRLRHRNAGGGWTWLEVSNHNHLDDPGNPRVVADMLDVSDEMAAQDALWAREQLLWRLAEALPLGVLQATVDRRVIYTNERLHRILGTGVSATLGDQFATVAPADLPVLEAAMDEVLSAGIDGDIEVSVETAEEPSRRCLLRLRALIDEQGVVTGEVVTVEDVTESSQLRAELERRATHDMLTHVLNRSSVVAALERALEPGSRGTSVIFVDLDRFKDVNDRLGHAAGDELLRIAAERLTSTVRSGDVLGRIGGDEFLVVCTAMAGPATAVAIAERIADCLKGSVELSGGRVELRASVGVAHTGGREIDGDELVRRADAAMYASKRQGEGRAVVYSPSLERPVRVA